MNGSFSDSIISSPISTPVSNHATEKSPKRKKCDSLSVPSNQSPQDCVSVSQSKLIYTDEICQRLRLIILCERECQVRMFHVYKWGINKGPNITLYQYLLQNKGFSRKNLKNYFTRDQLGSIEHSSEADDFDVTLLYLCIQFACEKVAHPLGSEKDKWQTVGETLEYFLYSVKIIRNTIIHNIVAPSKVEFLAKVEEVRTILLKMLEAARILYNVHPQEVQNVITDMNININRIRDDPLTPLDKECYRNQLIFPFLVEQMKTSSNAELKELYMRANIACVKPVSFLVGLDISIDVNEIFTTLNLAQDKRGGKEQCIKYEDILKLTIPLTHQSKETDDKIVLIEGIAGCGKTTLAKIIVSQWCSGVAVIKDLNFYDLLILMECRNHLISNIRELLDLLMPKTLEQFQKDDLLPLFKRQQVLILVDGLDEITASSMNLLQELLSLKKNTNIQIVVFSRPEKVMEFYKLVKKDYKVAHIRVGNIPSNKWEDFVKVYHKALKKQCNINQNTKSLVHYLRTTGSHLHHLWGLPINLAILTILWAVASGRVNNVTTATELYIEIVDLSIEKLCERLKAKRATSASSDSELKKSVKKFLWILSRVALEGLRDGNIAVTSDAHQHLQQVCDSLGLPQDEVLGAFLVMKNSWTLTSIKPSESFPHRGAQEFFAALLMLHVMCGGSIEKESSRVKEAATSLAKLGFSSREIQDAILKLLQPEELTIPTTLTSPLSVELSTTTTTTTTTTTATINATVNAEAAVAVVKATAAPADDVVLHGATSSFQCNALSIRGILEKLYKENPEDLKLGKYQNTLIHLLGLMHMVRHTSTVTYKEIIQMLKESGIDTIYDWLRVLSGVRCDETVAACIAQIPGLLDSTHKDYALYNLFPFGEHPIDLDDKLISSSLVLFKFLHPKEVRIQIESDPILVPELKELLSVLSQSQCLVNIDISDATVSFYQRVMTRIKPNTVNIKIKGNLTALCGLEELLLLLAHQQCEVKTFDLQSAWRHPESVPDSFGHAVAGVLFRCKVQNYNGRASWFLKPTAIPSIRRVKLSVLDQKDADTLTTIHRILPNVDSLSVNVAPDIYPRLQPFPSTQVKQAKRVYKYLYLSRVGNGHSQWAAEVIANLTSSRDMEDIHLLECLMTKEGFENLLHCLHRDGWRSRGKLLVMSKDPEINKNKIEDLNDFAWQNLGCRILLAEHCPWDSIPSGGHCPMRK